MIRKGLDVNKLEGLCVIGNYFGSKFLEAIYKGLRVKPKSLIPSSLAPKIRPPLAPLISSRNPTRV